MKCRICGAELPPSTEKCPLCDTPVTTRSVVTPKKQAKYGEVVRRFNYRAEGTAQLVMYILLAVFFLLLGFGVPSVVIAILAIAEGLLSKYLYNRRFLSVNEHGVVGIGQGASAMGFFDYQNDHYAFIYDDIISIKKETFGTSLCVDTTCAKVKIQLPYLPNKETKEAIEAIERASGLQIH